MISKNDASQTLFRFVSLRNPKLTEIKTKNLGFIQRPTGIVGIFDRAVINRVPSVSKIEAMEDLIYSGVFESEAFVSEKELETGQYSELLTIGKKIARNEFLTDTDWKYTKNYYTNLVDSNGELKNENLNSFDQLWNNLIYQVISQKDFYVKEAISHVLKAIHFGFAQFINNVKVDKEVIAIALNSKIVLPKELFANDDYGAPSATESNTKTSLDKVTNQRLIANAKCNL